MIENEKQYKLTKEQARRFAEALEELLIEQREGTSGLHPHVDKARRDAVLSQLDDLNAQIKEYEERKEKEKNNG